MIERIERIGTRNPYDAPRAGVTRAPIGSCRTRVQTRSMRSGPGLASGFAGGRVESSSTLSAPHRRPSHARIFFGLIGFSGRRVNAGRRGAGLEGRRSGLSCGGSATTQAAEPRVLVRMVDAVAMPAGERRGGLRAANYFHFAEEERDHGPR